MYPVQYTTAAALTMLCISSSWWWSSSSSSYNTQCVRHVLGSFLSSFGCYSFSSVYTQFIIAFYLCSVFSLLLDDYFMLVKALENIEVYISLSIAIYVYIQYIYTTHTHAHVSSIHHTRKSTAYDRTMKRKKQKKIIPTTLSLNIIKAKKHFATY